MRRHEWIGLLLVVMLAAGLRFYRLDSVEFYHDDAMLSMLAQEMADGQTLPLQGIVSSVGIPNPPITVYTLVPAFWLWNDVVFVTGWVALLNVGGVALLYLIALRWLGFWPALVAAVLYASNPWAVMYSRKIWAQDYATPFLLLALWLAQYGFNNGSRAAQVLILPVMVWGMQIHFAAWALLPLFGWLIWTGRRRWHWPSLMVGVGLAALVLTPFVLGIVQTLTLDPQGLSSALARGTSQQLDGGVSMWVHWVRLLTGDAVSTWMLPDDTSVMGMPVWANVFALLSVGVGGWAVIRRSGGWRIGLALGLWMLLPPLAFDLVLNNVWPHYLVPVLPAFALLAGAAVTALPPRRWMRGALLIGCAAYAAAGAGQWGDVLNQSIARHVQIGAGTSGYTTPAFILNRVIDALPREVEDVIVLTREMDIWFDSEAARWPVMLRDRARCVRALPVDGYAVWPADGNVFALLVTPDGGPSLSARYGETAVQTSLIPNRDGAAPYQVAIFDDRPTWTGPMINALEAPVHFENGVQLTGYGRAGNQVYLSWVLPDAPDRRFYEARQYDVQYFVHVLDAKGQRIAQADARFWQARHWCAGDTLYTWVAVDGLDSLNTLRVGFYRLGEGAQAGQIFALDVLDDQGNAAGNWIDLPIIAP